MFNRGEGCIVRSFIALYTLRQHYQGPVTMFLEESYPHEFEETCKYFNVDIVHNPKRHEVRTLIRKTETFMYTPYDRTLWLDADAVVLGPIDEMFDYLDDNDVAIPHFAGWWSDGGIYSRRIKKYKGIAAPKYIDEALKHHPAVNTGIVAYRKCKFIEDWIELAIKGGSKKGKEKIFIADEVAFQVLYPSYDRIFIAPRKFNVSVKHDHGETKDPRIIHYHGDKHVLEHPNCEHWKETFNKMRKENIANINAFMKYADKRLKRWLQHPLGVTIVTACDEHYVEILKHTFPNWRKYKKIDQYPVIVFVNGMELSDPRLDFLRLPNVKLIEWSLPEADSHREEMLSAFVFGAADNVQTDYWMKLDADSFATDDRPFITDKMKQYAFCGHRWGYSRPQHIKDLDAWAKGHWKRKLKRASPMIDEGRIEKNRFYHNTKRTISFVQLHETRFTKFCIKLLKERKLPVPSQDTFMYYVCDRFDKQRIGIMNFKKRFGFTQGRGKHGPERIKAQLEEIDRKNAEKNKTENVDSPTVVPVVDVQLTKPPNSITKTEPYSSVQVKRKNIPESETIWTED